MATQWVKKVCCITEYIEHVFLLTKSNSFIHILIYKEIYLYKYNNEMIQSGFQLQIDC